MIEGRTEAVSLIYEKDNTGAMVPTIATIRDEKSRHAVMYKLVEMNADDIEKSFNHAAGHDTLQAKLEAIKESPTLG